MAEKMKGGDESLPQKLAVVPLLGRPIFPGIFTPIMINNPVDMKLIDEAMTGDAMIGLVLSEKESDKPSADELCRIGTSAKIVKKINLPDGGINIFISTLKRFKIVRAIHKSDPIVVSVEYLEDKEEDTSEVKALTRTLISEMKQISENNPLFSEEMRLNMVNIDNPGRIADFSASILNIDKKDQQKILETLNVRVRMENVLVFIKKEQDIMRIQKRVQNEISQKVEKNQREYFLREELKAIKTELGMAADSKSSEYNRFKEQFDKFKFEGEVKEAVEQELEKFNLMEHNSPEFVVTRNYLDWIVCLPWLDPPAEQIDLRSASRVLEDEHYGLKDVKTRIIEFLAVRKLRKDNKGSILCLVGPPGVGKTSVGRSVARAMGKEFFRFSVGGMRDEGEIKGHRRTYIGAMPGKIIQGLKIAKTKAPVFMIDEIDKMGASYSGDPSSALLEVLDPEQNFSFRDHYLDLPFDVSRIFFIVTANTLDKIPIPLLDRMEIIELPGYIDSEKLEIAKNFLVPKSLEKSGLKRNQVKWARDSLLYIANGYSREAGVRNFEKNLDKVHRKLAKIIVDRIEAEEALNGEAVGTGAASKMNRPFQSEGKAKTACGGPFQSEGKAESASGTGEKFVIDKKTIEKYLGKPIFPEGVYKKADKAGMAVGLAWTRMGGDTLIIEATSVPGKGGLTLTGKMGTVMKESAMIAMTFARKLACEEYEVSEKWFEKNHVHLHIPEGATPKDGPSAGITMATALLSLFLKKVVRQHLAMTGELSLTGQVLPIGGLKEKTVAAQRNKARHIIIPKQNLRDLDEIPDIVKEGIEFHPVERFEEVLAWAFEELACR